VQKPGHTPDFWKTHPDARTGTEKVDISGETRLYGNPKSAGIVYNKTCTNTFYNSRCYLSLLPYYIILNKLMTKYTYCIKLQFCEGMCNVVVHHDSFSTSLLSCD